MVPSHIWPTGAGGKGRGGRGGGGGDAGGGGDGDGGGGDGGGGSDGDGVQLSQQASLTVCGYPLITFCDNS